MRRLGMLLPAVLVLGFAVPAAASAPRPLPAPRWVACENGLECATARVPFDYHHPHGRTITLALYRRPATEPAHRIGSLFVNPGGPGGSPLSLVKDAELLWTAGVRARFDIVGFDPRGVAGSSPVRCFPSAQDEHNFLNELPAFPVTVEEQTRYLGKLAEFSASCDRTNAEMLRHMSTANVARDMDLLRQAVGDARLNYDGVSYGTYLGLTYANMFPDRVRALVLDGVIEPVAWATGRGDAPIRPYSLRVGGAQGSTETLDQFFQLCDRAGAGCPFAGAAAAKFAALSARLQLHPVGGLTYAGLIAQVRPLLYRPALWPDLATFLQQAYLGADPTRAAVTAATDYDNTIDAQMAVACADTDNPRDPWAWPRAAAAADRRYPYFGSIWAYDSLACGSWPERDVDRYTGPFNRHISTRTLVIGNRYDPATPYRNAQAVAAEVPGARLLTLDGWGHNSLTKSGCVNGYVERYLVDLSVPAPGIVCQPDHRPFG
jgi:pimeloyl-ACP methyl ester carboxylesterase